MYQRIPIDYLPLTKQDCTREWFSSWSTTCTLVLLLESGTFQADASKIHVFNNLPHCIRNCANYTVSKTFLLMQVKINETNEQHFDVVMTPLSSWE